METLSIASNGQSREIAAYAMFGTSLNPACFLMDSAGQVVYRLKQPFRGGTTHVLFSPEDFIARLAAAWERPHRVGMTGPSPRRAA